MTLTKKRVEDALANTLWDVGNQALYDLCHRNPKHDRDDVITAKIWLIGRAYSAAIERRRETKGVAGDRFYSDVVAPQLRQSKIDQWLPRAHTDPTNPRVILQVHKRLTDVFEDMTGMRKTSLSSKYLHFHVPSAFFIIDSRAKDALRALRGSFTEEDTPSFGKGSYDPDYAAFYFGCLALTSHIEDLTGKRPSPRELDKVLLATSASS